MRFASSARGRTRASSPETVHSRLSARRCSTASSAHRNAAATARSSVRSCRSAAAADFVLVDDGDSVNRLRGTSAMQSIRLDPERAPRRPHGGAVACARRLQDLCALGQFLAAGRRRAVRGDLANRRQDRRFRPRIRRARLTDFFSDSPFSLSCGYLRLNAPFTTFARARRAAATGNEIATLKAPDTRSSAGIGRRTMGSGSQIQSRNGTQRAPQQGGAGAVRPLRRGHFGGGLRLARLPDRHQPAEFELTTLTPTAPASARCSPPPAPSSPSC